MKHRLFIIEGLPCSGKSTTAAYAAELLKQYGKVRFVDEGTGDHPADYEFHALVPAGFLSEKSQIVPLSQFSGSCLTSSYNIKYTIFYPGKQKCR